MNFSAFRETYERKKVTEYGRQVRRNPLVSVIVLTYNHAKYIKDCLNGILMQQTDYSIEILIGEDCSTDGTREICLNYARKYPSKIRLLLHHRENIITMNGNPTPKFNAAYSLFSAKGKYLAICEGDDYWTDPQKLQKQVNFMESNDDCSLCYHPTKVTFADNSGTDHIQKVKGVETLKKFSLNQFIEGNGLSMSTLTMMFRAEIVSKIPDWFNDAPIGDLPLKLICGQSGLIGYIPEAMAVHVRASTNHSWSYGRANIQWILKDLHANHHTYVLFDEYTKHRYHTAIQKVKRILFRKYMKIAHRRCNRRDQLKLLRRYYKSSLSLEKSNITLWLNILFGKRTTARLFHLKNLFSYAVS